MDKWGSSLRSMGTKMTAGVTTPILAAGGAVVSWAADLEQTLGATEVLWGSNTDTMLAWAKSADTSLGMTQNEALANANRFNAMFKTIGAGEGVVMDMSQGFTQLSSDLSAMWGGNPAEAADALTSALRGNYEGLDKYNINLTEAMVSQEAMNVAMADGRDEITEADKTQARYNLIMEQSTDAQGQFAAETNTTAGRLAIMRARVKNIGTAFGTMLLPYVNKALEFFSRMVDWLSKLDSGTRKWILVIAGVAAAMGPVLLILGMLLPGLSALLAVIGFLLSPIGLIVIAIAALAAGLIYAYTHFEGFREIVDTVASTLMSFATGALSAVVDAFNKLKSAFQAGGFSEMFSTLGNMALNGMQAIGSAIASGVSWIVSKAGEWAGQLLSAGLTWLQGLWDGAVSKWNEVTAWLGGLASDAATWLGDTASTLLQKGTDLISGIASGASTKWTEFTTWLGGLAAEVVTWVGDMATTLWQKGVDLIIGLGNGITTQWVNLTTWLAGVAGYVVAAIGDLVSTLWQKGVDLVVGLGDGITTQWANLKTWVSGTAGRVVSAVGDVASTLWQKGVDLLVGLGSGITAQWVNVKSWVSGIGGRIVDAVGNLASSLYNAGVAVMDGLKDGLVAGWNTVTEFLGGLNPADWKGPEERDKKMLYKPGIWIMEGLGHGLDEGWNDVTRQLSGYVPTVNSAIGSGLNGGSGGNTYYVFQVVPEKLHQLMADAKDGGHMARNFGNELAMMEGMA